MNAPEPIIALYQEAQVNTDMDHGTYVGGTDYYAVDRIIEAIASLVGWTLPPRMNLNERKRYLIAAGRRGEIEYLGVNGD